MSNLFQVPVIIEKIESMADRGWGLKLHTRELTPPEAGLLSSLKGKEVWAVMAEREILPEDIKVSKERVERGEKTPSQRLRAVLFVLWEQTEKTSDFDTFYRQKVEQFIDKIKEKLD